jgi:hypothetical protein
MMFERQFVGAVLGTAVETVEAVDFLAVGIPAVGIPAADVLAADVLAGNREVAL